MKVANFKVKCIASGGSNFIKGNIYNVEDGYITLESNCKFSKRFICVEEMNSYFQSKFELVTEPEQFTKDMLKTGDVVVYKCGTIGVVMLETANCGSLIRDIYGHMPFNGINDCLGCDTNPEYDIKMIFRPTSSMQVFSVEFLSRVNVNAKKSLQPNLNLQLIWQRPELLEMTHADIVKALGHDYKFVKE